MNTPYKITEASTTIAPLIISVPHCGTFFPEEIRDEFRQDLIAAPDDTDWFVDQLYDFVPALGATMITAVNSRWVIDLNRDADSKPLYNDGRIITALCPTTTFLGEPIYKDSRKQVADDEVNRRYAAYYLPYHQKIQSLLDERKKQFGKVLLWDCHSIRQIVPTIQAEKFPDLILGDADGRSSSSALIEQAVASLDNNGYRLQHNHPFKGGTITRSFGKPDHHQHALQLEMTKVNYMNDAEQQYDKQRAEKMREVLRRTLNSLVEMLLK